MKVLVTGASGYIGFAVACAMRRAGHEVFGMVRRADAKAQLQRVEINPVLGSMQEPMALQSTIDQCSVLIHAAADYQADTLKLDRLMVEALTAAGRGAALKTVIYTSGVWVYGDSGDDQVDESTSLRPVRQVKQRPETERFILEHPHVRGLVIRPGCVYGGRGGLTGIWFGAAEKGEVNIIGDGHNRWAMVHVDDLAEAYLRVAESGLRGEVFNITDRSRSSVNEMVQAAVIAAGGHAKIKHVPLTDAEKNMGDFAECLALNQHVDSRKAVRLLGWQPKHGGFVDGISTYHAAWKAWQ